MPNDLVFTTDRNVLLPSLPPAAGPLVLLSLNITCLVVYWLSYSFYILRGELVALAPGAINRAVHHSGGCHMCLLP